MKIDKEKFVYIGRDKLSDTDNKNIVFIEVKKLPDTDTVRYKRGNIFL